MLGWRLLGVHLKGMHKLRNVMWRNIPILSIAPRKFMFCSHHLLTYSISHQEWNRKIERWVKTYSLLANSQSPCHQILYGLIHWNLLNGWTIKNGIPSMPLIRSFVGALIVILPSLSNVKQCMGYNREFMSSNEDLRHINPGWILVMTSNRFTRPFSTLLFAILSFMLNSKSFQVKSFSSLR